MYFAPPQVGDLRSVSELHIDQLLPLWDELIKKYESKEILSCYCTGFNGVTNGDISVNSLVQYSSPCLSREFIDYCVKIPITLRKDRKLYLDWYSKYYSEFKNVYYYNNSFYRRPVAPTIYKRTLFQRIKRKMMVWYYIKHYGLDESKGMYPIDKWVDDNNEMLKEILNNFLDNFTDPLKATMKTQFMTESSASKINLVTLAYVVNKYMLPQKKEMN